MLEAHLIFDARTDILASIKKLAQQEAESGDEVTALRVVGQEQDGFLLYTWAAQAAGNKSTGKVTHVGLYNPTNKTNKTLFMHEALVEIVNCSVSQEHTFLGFVTHEHTYISEGYGRRQKQERYRAYLAEVPASAHAPCRVFYLNLERAHYLRLQFLYGAYHGQVSRREAHLLVFLHREYTQWPGDLGLPVGDGSAASSYWGSFTAIGLYHIPMARVGTDGVILSGEPKKEQIFQKPFVWSQWDATHQRLYIVQFRRQLKTPHSCKSRPGASYRAYLTGYQFTETTANQFMLDVPLDLPIPYWKSSSQRSYYEDPAPHTCIPDSSINMCVVARSNGTMCVCFQHPAIYRTLPQSTKAGPRTPTAPAGEQDEHTLQYSIAMLHHGRTLTCTGLPAPRGAAGRCRFLFVPQGDYLAVHLPGHFTHLLNVGVELHPCHHILWHEPGENEVGVEDAGKRRCEVSRGSSLLPILWDRHVGGQASGAFVYDPCTQRAFRLGICHDTLSTYFAESASPRTRLAIFHYAVLHQRDLVFTRTLFESLLIDTASLELGGMLAEFLVGSTYAALRGQMELYVMRLMPFTCAATYREQAEQVSDGGNTCSITYTALGAVTFSSQSKVKGGHQAIEMWRNLVAAAGTTPAAPRFTSRLVQHHLEAGEEDDMEFVMIDSEELPSLFQKLTTAAKSSLKSSRAGADSSSGDSHTVTNAPPRSEVLLGRPPAFLSASPPTVDSQQEQLVNMTSHLLTAHLKRFLKRDSRNKIRCLTSEYITCQMQQSRHLVHILCMLLVPDDTPSVQTLDAAASRQEHALFRCLKRYQLALEEQAFPHPPGFPFYMACLAYRCLPFSVFKQYADGHVVQVSRELMEKLIAEVPDDVETVPKKMAVLLMLPPGVGVSCARRWDHPLTRRFLATRYVDACLNDGEKDDFLPVYSDGSHHHHPHSPAAESSAPHGVGFPPLTTLIAAMERKVSRQASRAKGAPLPIDRHFLQEVGLADLYAGGCNHDDILTFG